MSAYKRNGVEMIRTLVAGIVGLVIGAGLMYRLLSPQVEAWQEAQRKHRVFLAGMETLQQEAEARMTPAERELQRRIHGRNTEDRINLKDEWRKKAQSNGR